MYNKSSNTTYTKGANEVYIQGMAFSPATLTITAGTTVKWNNKDAVAHTVTSDSTLFDSGIISANGIYTYTFAKEGTYFYHCELHANMKAKVIVNAYVPPSGGYTGY
jgi:plastocyanin